LETVSACHDGFPGCVQLPGSGFGSAAAGVEERKIANVSRHKDLPVLRHYIRAATAFDDVGQVL
jgi:hypothetical protein